MRVLLVEDSRRQRDYVGQAFRRAGYAIDIADNGEDGLWLAQSNDYDVVVLDIMLPKLDGLSVLAQLRDGGNDTHVLLLTAKDTVDDRVKGLDQGADDYLVKPFAMAELIARVQALARRRHGVKAPTLAIGGLVIDTTKRAVTREGVAIDLAPREYALLEYMAMRRGEVISRTEIEAHIYDERSEPMSNVVDTAIYKLRRKIDVDGEPSLIETRRGMGYTLRSVDEA